MTNIFQCLEPRKADPGEILYYELDEFYEFIFFQKGHLDIGFQLNHKTYIGLRKYYRIHIGSMGCTFNQNSEFLYQART